jgi:glycosyltransferase involved in cell wall biosynthesis
MLASGRVISVIVPIRDEPAERVDAFARVAQEAELIVADRGSGSALGEALRRCGARILEAPGESRGARLARAARGARGDILLFLHADSRPPREATRLVEAAVADGAGAGCFLLGYDRPGAAYRWIAAWANLRTRILRLPYGDQGLFCTRAAYERAGGFRDLPICDDLDFVRRLRREPGFRVIPERCVTSARRYEGRAFRQVMTNWRVLAGYFLGVPGETLERWYRGARTVRPS